MNNRTQIVMGWTHLDYLCTYNSPVHGPIAVHRHWWSSVPVIEARWRDNGGPSEVRREQQRRLHEHNMRFGFSASGKGVAA